MNIFILYPTPTRKEKIQMAAETGREGSAKGETQWERGGGN
jgi:hypothetical protein